MCQDLVQSTFTCFLYTFCTSQILDEASDDDAAMRDASVTTSDDKNDHPVGATAPPAADLFKSDAASANNHEVLDS